MGALVAHERGGGTYALWKRNKIEGGAAWSAIYKAKIQVKRPQESVAIRTSPHSVYGTGLGLRDRGVTESAGSRMNRLRSHLEVPSKCGSSARETRDLGIEPMIEFVLSASRVHNAKEAAPRKAIPGVTEKDGVSGKAPEGPVPLGSGRFRLDSRISLPVSEPPLTPLAALSLTIISGMSTFGDNGDDTTRRIDLYHETMKRIEENRGRGWDERDRAFMRMVWPLISAAGLAISESRKRLGDQFAEAKEKAKSEIEEVEARKDFQLTYFRRVYDIKEKHLESSRPKMTVPSLTAWFGSIGVSAAVIYKLQQEILAFISLHYPNLKDLKYLTYTLGVSAVVGIGFAVKKIINHILNKKELKAAQRFHSKELEEERKFRDRKEDIESKLAQTESELASDHTDQIAGLGGYVYAMVFELCYKYYPASECTLNDQNYIEYSRLREGGGTASGNGGAQKEAFAYMNQVGTEQARMQLTNPEAFTSFSLSGLENGNNGKRNGNNGNDSHPT